MFYPLSMHDNQKIFSFRELLDDIQNQGNISATFAAKTSQSMIEIMEQYRCWRDRYVDYAQHFKADEKEAFDLAMNSFVEALENAHLRPDNKSAVQWIKGIIRKNSGASEEVDLECVEDVEAVYNTESGNYARHTPEEKKVLKAIQYELATVMSYMDESDRDVIIDFMQDPKGTILPPRVKTVLMENKTLSDLYFGRLPSADPAASPDFMPPSLGNSEPG